MPFHKLAKSNDIGRLFLLFIHLVNINCLSFALVGKQIPHRTIQVYNNTFLAILILMILGQVFEGFVEESPVYPSSVTLRKLK